MEPICVSNLSNRRLGTLLGACFDERPEISREARHLSRFFLEYKLIKHAPDQNEQYEAELTEKPAFRKEYGGLHLFSGEFDGSEITDFVRCLVEAFLERPGDRQELAIVLKQAGSITGIQEKIAEFIQYNWGVDERATNQALEIIWDTSVLARLKGTLTEIVERAADEALRDHASQLLSLLRELRLE